MRLGANFSSLLGTVLVACAVVDARPAERGLANTVTVPVSRIHQTREGVDSAIVHQQHVNRAHQRFARATGGVAPTDAELRSNLHARISELPAELQKRYLWDGMTDMIDKIKADWGKGDSDKNSTSTDESNNPLNKGNVLEETSGGYSQSDLDASNDNTLTEADKPSANNSIGLDITANDVGYVAKIQIGSPAKDYKLLVDSGSADLWVGGDDCTSDQGSCGNHAFLGSSSSSSFNDTKQSWSTSYGSGQVSGTIVKDDVSIAGLKLSGHTFGIAHNESNNFAADGTLFDGILGLASSSLSRQKTDTVVDALQKAGLIKDAITSYKLARLSDGTNDGEITFGAMDPAKFNPNAQVTLKNINTDGYWEGNIDSIKVDGQDLGLSGKTAILDTGTTLLMGPGGDVDTIFSKIDGSRFQGQQWIIPCTTEKNLTFTFGGHDFNIDARDLSFLPVSNSNLTGDCYSSINRGGPGGENQWLVGDVFLKNVYLSTNVGKNEITLAELN